MVTFSTAPHAEGQQFQVRGRAAAFAGSRYGQVPEHICRPVVHCLPGCLRLPRYTAEPCGWPADRHFWWYTLRIPIPAGGMDATSWSSGKDIHVLAVAASTRISVTAKYRLIASKEVDIQGAQVTADL